MENNICGIYKIENKINGKAYIGQSVNIPARWRRHCVVAHNSTMNGYDYPLYKAIRKYGLENFDFSVLEYCELNELNEKEKFYIQKYDAVNNGYNQTLENSPSGHYVKISSTILAEIIDLLQNSNLSQADIARKFSLSKNTITNINKGKTLRQDDIVYPIRENIYLKYYCVDCGKEIQKGSIRCRECYLKDEKKFQPSKEKLLSLLIENKGNFTAVGKLFNKTGNSVVRWCKNYDLPFHTADYYNKPKKENRPHIDYKYIIKLDKKTKQEIKRYNSIRESAEDIKEEKELETSIDLIIKNIKRCANGNRQTAYGYSWAKE